MQTMHTSFQSNTYMPDLVQISKALAERNSFNDSCSDEVGRFLAVHVSHVSKGEILEVGTGFRVGSSWILSAISPSVQFISIDHSKKKIDLVNKTIIHKQGEFILGDWKDIINRGPFQFIFADASIVKSIEADRLFDILEIGGMLFMDDFTPVEHFPEEWKGKPDKAREFWLNHSGLIATEIYLTPMTAAILATRIK